MIHETFGQVAFCTISNFQEDTAKCYIVHRPEDLDCVHAAVRNLENVPSRHDLESRLDRLTKGNEHLNTSQTDETKQAMDKQTCQLLQAGWTYVL